MMMKGQQAADKKLVGPLRRRHVLGKRRLVAAPRPTRWASARSTSTCAAANRRGSSVPGAEATALADELSAKLLTMTDPDDGTQDHPRRLQARRHLHGPLPANAAELQVGMNDGYRVSWQTTLGGSPPGIVYKNDRKWSADHGGYDFAITSGVFVTNRPITRRTRASSTSRRRCCSYFGSGDPDGHRWQAALLSCRPEGAALPVTAGFSLSPRRRAA